MFSPIMEMIMILSVAIHFSFFLFNIGFSWVSYEKRINFERRRYTFVSVDLLHFQFHRNLCGLICHYSSIESYHDPKIQLTS